MLKHINTSKHTNAILTQKYKESHGEDIKTVAKSPDDESYACACGRKYKFSSGLWRHNKMCNGNNRFVVDTPTEPIVQNTDTSKLNISNIFIPTPTHGAQSQQHDVIYELLKEICFSNAETNKKNIELQTQNIELQTQMIELMKSQSHNTNNITNTMNNCNNTNTQVNINMFLNEQCKDAITLNAFIQSISPTFDEVMYMANNGNKEGLYKILKNSFSQIELTKRPMHCTDLKRHTTYVKDETGWLKDHDQTHLRKLCGKVEHACLVKTLAIIEGDERYTTNGTEEYEDSIRMMQESVGGRKGPVYNHGLILKSLEEQIALDQEKMKNTIKN